MISGTFATDDKSTGGRATTANMDAHSTKRRAVIDDDEDMTDPITDDESVTPNSDSRKKPRLSRDESEESYGSVISSDREINATQDEPVTESEDEEADISYRSLNDEEAVQRVAEQRRNNVNRTRVVSENAIIEEIQCINFMCHGNLTIPVGPLINFIVGHNGSGKSAVLTALTICLGGKASATNRGGSLKAFIKEGKERCVLSVKIKNQGKSAYKPDLYGPSIIVERYFSRNASSGYNLKSSTGKKISTRRDDLEDILDYYMLQLDNPMNVLSQDMARQFLNSSSATDKYRFFQKGTQLERLDSDYAEAEIITNQLGALQRDVCEQTSELKGKYNVAKKNSQSIIALQATQNKIFHVKAQICWVQVEDEEKILSNMEDDIVQMENEIREHQTAFDGAAIKYDDADSKIQRLEEKKEQIKEELPPLTDQLSDMMEKFHEHKKTMLENKSEERKIQDEITACNRRVAQFKKDIDVEKQRLEEQSGGRSHEITIEMESVLGKIAEAKRKLQEHRSSIEETKSAELALVEARDERRRERESRQQKVHAYQSRIKEIQQGGGSTVMDQNVRNVLADIAKESRFREKPVGPIWKHIFLKDQQWSSVLEVSIGGTLDGFCVTCKHDRDLLAAILRKRNLPQIKILIGNAQPIDTTNHEPSREFSTILRILKFDNDLVRNQLIINQAIDQTVLIRSRQESVDTNARRPANVKQIFCFHDDQRSHRGAGHRLANNNAGEQSITPIYAYRGRPRLQADIKDQLAHERSNLEAEAQELHAAEQSLREANGRIEDNRKTVKHLEYRLKMLTPETQRLEDKKGELEDELARFDSTKASTLPSLESEMKSAEDELANSESAKKEMSKELAKASREARAIHDERSQIEANIAVIDEKIKDAQDRVRDAMREREQILLVKNTHDASKRTTEAAKQQLVAEREAQLTQVQEFTEAALLGSKEFIKESIRVSVPDGATEQSLTQLESKLIEELRSAQALVGGSEEELRLKELAAKEAYEEMEKRQRDNERLIRQLSSSLTTRRSRWVRFRQEIAIRASTAFNNYLYERQFRGQLRLDHEAKELVLTIEPDIMRRTDKGRGTKTLSGGEKSFSTICLLLSLWEAMGSPIRCLDEFDVFMDSVNRDVSMQMMISAARNAAGRQFILITPQSMSKIRIGTDIKICKMSDPERGQTTITVA